KIPKIWKPRARRYAAKWLSDTRQSSKSIIFIRACFNAAEDLCHADLIEKSRIVQVILTTYWTLKVLERSRATLPIPERPIPHRPAQSQGSTAGAEGAR